MLSPEKDQVEFKSAYQDNNDAMTLRERKSTEIISNTLFKHYYQMAFYWLKFVVL